MRTNYLFERSCAFRNFAAGAAAVLVRLEPRRRRSFECVVLTQARVTDALGGR